MEHESYYHLFPFLILLLLYFLIIEVVSYSGKLRGVKEWTLSYIFFFLFSMSNVFFVRYNYLIGATLSVSFYITGFIYVQYSIAKYNRIEHHFWASMIFGFILVMFGILNLIFRIDDGSILNVLFACTMVIVSLETILFIRLKLILKENTKMYFPTCITMSLFIVIYILRIIYNMPFGVYRFSSVHQEYLYIFSIVFLISVSLSLNYIYKWFYIDKIEYQSGLHLQEVVRVTNESEIDLLTQVYNRKKIQEILHEYISKSQLDNNILDFVVVLLDIDNFKECNDKFGHTFGDQVLVKFCDFIKSRIRSTDILARWGGDEFILLLPNISLENTYNIMNKMQEQYIKIAGEKDYLITFSYGTEKFNPSYTFDTLFDEIDRRMYLNKGKHK